MGYNINNWRMFDFSKLTKEKILEKEASGKGHTYAKHVNKPMPELIAELETKKGWLSLDGNPLMASKFSVDPAKLLDLIFDNQNKRREFNEWYSSFSKYNLAFTVSFGNDIGYGYAKGMNNRFILRKLVIVFRKDESGEAYLESCYPVPNDLQKKEINDFHKSWINRK